MNRLTRVDRILQSHARVKLAVEQLENLPFTDERFVGALNEYHDALENRSIVEKVKP